MLYSITKRTIIAACFMIFSYTAVLPCQSAKIGQPMLRSQDLINILGQSKVSVGSMESIFNTPGAWMGEFFYIHPADPTISQVTIGFEPGHKLDSAIPAYIEVSFRKPLTLSIKEIVPACTNWKELPFVTLSTPYPYRCTAISGPTIRVYVSVNLTGELGAESSKVNSITFTRERAR